MKEVAGWESKLEKSEDAVKIAKCDVRGRSNVNFVAGNISHAWEEVYGSGIEAKRRRVCYEVYESQTQAANQS